MKLISVVLPLLTLGSIYAFHSQYKREFSNLLSNKVQNECGNAISKITKENEECTFSFDKNKRDDDCKILNIEKCQNFINMNIADLPECKNTNLPDINEMNNFRNLFNLSFKYACAMDENNNYCPFTDISPVKYDATMNNTDKKAALEKAKAETCKSKKCTESYIDLVENIDKQGKEYLESLAKEIGSEPPSSEDLKIIGLFNTDPNAFEAMEYFKSEQCTSQFGNVSSSTTKTIIKYINLYAMLSLLSLLYIII